MDCLYIHRFCNTRAAKNTQTHRGCAQQYLLLLFFPSNTRARRPLISYYNNQVTYVLETVPKKSVCTPPCQSILRPEKVMTFVGKNYAPSPPVPLVLSWRTLLPRIPRPTMCEILNHKIRPRLLLLKISDPLSHSHNATMQKYTKIAKRLVLTSN